MNELVKYLIEEIVDKNIIVYGGGFKPVSAGHFLVAKEAIKQIPNFDKFIIYVGKESRDGITQEQSIKIWDIFKNYISDKIEILPSDVSPIISVRNLAKENPNTKINWILGSREGKEDDVKDFIKRTKNIEKYPNLNPINITTPNIFSGTKARDAIKLGKEEFLKNIPNELSNEDKEKVWNIINGINEMSQSSLQAVEDFADKELDPLDIEFTNHFFDRLNDPRNIKPISPAELIGFFKRLANKKPQLIDFLKKYKEIVAVDKRTNINIPLVQQANSAIAKTIMRKKDFKTFDPKIELSEQDLIPGGLAQGKTLEDIAKHHNVNLDVIKLQLEKGIKVELEHTTDSNVAKEIAMDHLFEDPNYYDKLGKIENNKSDNFKKYIKYLDEILMDCCEMLGIPDRPKVNIILNENYSQQHFSFGGYKPGLREIDLVIKNRTCSDSGRTLAHEIRHYKQDLDGVLNEDSGKDGSEHENECNSFSGKVMRKFNRQYPEILNLTF